jgi:hypothetical protein
MISTRVRYTLSPSPGSVCALSVSVVYVAPFAPNDGQTTLDLIVANPTPVGTQLVPDTFGFLKLSPKGVFEVEQEVLSATQRPNGRCSIWRAHQLSRGED